LECLDLSQLWGERQEVEKGLASNQAISICLNRLDWGTDRLVLKLRRVGAIYSRYAIASATDAFIFARPVAATIFGS
jgi:hypothetical protein